MKALIVGGGGQLGRALAATAPAGLEVTSLDSAALDIADAAAVAHAVASMRPALILNAAAYTAVDRAESEEARAHAVNADGVAHLAAAAQTVDARLLHVSTDFVFDGRSAAPYACDAAPNPLSAYGRTKLAGERLAGPDALIVRTAWVYAATGRSFLTTMLRLMRERPEIRVVADQIGTPTHATGLARALWRLADIGAMGLHHYTDAGVASWYDFAVAIREEALAMGLLEQAAAVVPITTAEYPTPAVRPACAVLDKGATWALLGGAAPHWREGLRETMREMRTHG